MILKINDHQYEPLMQRTFVAILFFFICWNGYAQPGKFEYADRMSHVYKLSHKNAAYDMIRELDTLIGYYPNESKLYAYRGELYFYLRDLSRAKADWQHAKDLGMNLDKRYIDLMISREHQLEGISEYCHVDMDLPGNCVNKKYSINDSLRGALRPERTCYDVYYYDLTVKIIPEEKRIEGKNEIYFHTVEATKTIQIDLAENYQIQTMEWNGVALDYTRKYNALFVSFPDELPAGTNQLIRIEYYGVPHVAEEPPWEGGFVWEKKRGNWWVGVACEHLGASSWWPCKDHLSEKPDSMQINVVVPSKYQAISNGNLRSKRQIDKNYTQFKWFVSYPINSYGVTFYMGDFVNFTDVMVNEHGEYPIDYYVLRHHLKKAKKFYANTKDIVEVYENLFGEYPYSRDGMAMVEAPYEGMEHQSAIAIGDVYSKKNREIFRMKDYNYLVVHEMAHEWWGNTVTMADMADAWISEGFATYAEHLFMEQKYGYLEYLYSTVTNARYVLNIWPVVGPENVNDNSFLGGDIYSKGAALLNNLRCTMNNDSLFFDMIKAYYQHFKFQQINSHDVVAFVNHYTGQDYTSLFNKFLYDVDPPVLEYSFSLQNKHLIFNYKWINVEHDFYMPFSITINNGQNHRLVGTTENRTFEASNIQSFYLPNEFFFNMKTQTHNSFTYFITHWNREEDLQ